VGAKRRARAGGNITITPLQHATVQVEYGGKVIQVDPAQGDVTKAKPGILVLVTDIHGDHLNPDLIAKSPEIRSAGRHAGRRAATGRRQDSRSGRSDGERSDENSGGRGHRGGADCTTFRGVLRRGSCSTPKAGGTATIVTLGGKRVYFAGDTECTPEMKALKNIDVVFIPMNLPYTMPPSEAAECVKAFKPAIAIPYHYQGQKPEEFQAALKGSGIEVRLLKWY